MPVGRWHVGKIVLFWVLCAIAALTLTRIAVAVDERADSERQRYASWRDDEKLLQQLAASAHVSRDSMQHMLAVIPAAARDSLPFWLQRRLPLLSQHPVSSPSRWLVLVQWLLGIGAVVAAALPFIVTWRWFTAREFRTGAAV